MAKRKVAVPAGSDEIQAALRELTGTKIVVSVVGKHNGPWIQFQGTGPDGYFTEEEIEALEGIGLRCAANIAYIAPSQWDSWYERIKAAVVRKADGDEEGE